MVQFRLLTTSVLVALMAFATPDAATAHGDQEIIYPGSQCRLRGDFERGQSSATCEGMTPNTAWRNLLAVSAFGPIGNIHRCGGVGGAVATSPAPTFNAFQPGELMVTCPVPRGVIRKGAGLDVFVKVATTPHWHGSDDERERINRNFRCELSNVNASGRGATARDTTGNLVVTTSEANVFGNGIHGIRTFGLSLRNTNAADSLSDRDVGAYVLNCVLPGMRGGQATRLIHYSVRERD